MMATETTGKRMHRFAADLYPICRSITGDGLRRTLATVQTQIPLTLRETPTGTRVFDWTVPKEWNIRDAWIKNSRGEKVVDFQRHSLHVLNYSTPFRGSFSLDELKKHLFTIPEHPDWIPYRTSYYQESWGFCLSHNSLLALEEGQYEVLIDSTLSDGSLTFGECYLPGESEDEILVSAHSCHPSLANDNLSGIAVATFLAARVAARKRRFSYRFLFAPGTIGVITWLALNQEHARKIKHGLVLTCVGDNGAFTYKKSRRGSAEIDRAMVAALRELGESHSIQDFSPYGYDERQYCSPGFNLAVGCLMRTPWGEFPEYHTSADNLEFIKPESLAGTLELCDLAFNIIEKNGTYQNQNPYCEPQLGRRGLDGALGGSSPAESKLAKLWVLNLSDGDHSLLDIAERSRLPFGAIREAADLLHSAGLLAESTGK